MASVEERLDRIEAILVKLEQVAAGYSIDKQNYIKRVDKIKASMGTKLAYNSDGLITSTLPLDQTDIPQLPMERIKDLDNTLNTKANVQALQALDDKVERYNKIGEIEKTGTVVNVDANGRVVSVEDLLPTNIPELPIEKIDGLREILDTIPSAPDEPIPHPTIAPGVAVKVGFDEHGHIVATYELGVEDIPESIREGISSNLSSIKSLNTALTELTNTTQQSLDKKIDKASPVTPGTYTKVSVNKDGVVIDGSMLTQEDIPSIPIDRVDKLMDALSRMATTGAIVELDESIKSIQSEMIVTIRNIQEELSAKVSKEELSAITSSLASIEDQLSTIAKSAISDQIINELNNINTELSSLSGRVAVLEDRLNIPHTAE